MSNSNLKKLSEAPCAPDQAVVSQLEKLLEMAKSGDLRGFVMFSAHRGGCTGEGCVGEISRGDILVAIEDWNYKSVRGRNE